MEPVAGNRYTPPREENILENPDGPVAGHRYTPSTEENISEGLEALY